MCLFSRCDQLLGTLSIDDEMGRRRPPEVKFSRANLQGMRKVVKTSSNLVPRASVTFVQRMGQSAGQKDRGLRERD